MDKKRAILGILLTLAAEYALAVTVFGPYHANMLHVIDGDTVKMALNTEPDHYWQVNIRVSGVDTPEIHHRKGWNPCQIPYGLAAKAYTQKWFQGATDIQVTRLMLGSYVHRAVADITAIKDGSRHSLGADLLASGHARKEVIGNTGKGWCQ